MFAPTLLDLAHRLNVGVGVMSAVFLVRAVGGVIGTVGSGVLMDHFPRKQYVLLSSVLLGGIAGIYELHTMVEYYYYEHGVMMYIPESNLKVF